MGTFAPVMMQPRLVASVFLLLFWILAIVRRRARHLLLLGGIPLVLLTRDVLQVFLPHAALFPISDIVLIAVYLAWLTAHSPRPALDLSALAVTILVAGVLVFGRSLPIVLHNSWLLHALAVVDFLYLSARFGATDAKTIIRPSGKGWSAGGQPEAEMILFAGSAACLVPLAVHLALAFGWLSSQQAVTSLLIAFSCIPHAFLIEAAAGRGTGRSETQAEAVSGDLEALCALMEELEGTLREDAAIDRILDRSIDCAVRSSGADAGAVFMVSDYEDSLSLRAGRGAFPGLPSATTLPLAGTFIGEVARGGAAVFLPNAAADPRWTRQIPVGGKDVLSIIAVPLTVKSRVMGVLAVVRAIGGAPFAEREFRLLRVLCGYIAHTADSVFSHLDVLERKGIELEQETASAIQQRLLPSSLPRWLDSHLAVYSQAAKEVIGDYYDILEINDHRIGILVGDVAGKGLQPILAKIMIRAIFHLLVPPERDPAAVLSWINRGITGTLNIEHYATLMFLVYDAKSREIICSNAAHLPLLIYRKDRDAFQKVTTEGLPIGIDRKARFGAKRIRLSAGDIAIVLTDGVIEAMNPDGQQYSLERLTRVLRQAAQCPPHEMLRRIRADHAQHVGVAPLVDDQTLLLLKVG